MLIHRVRESSILLHYSRLLAKVFCRAQSFITLDPVCGIAQTHVNWTVPQCSFSGSNLMHHPSKEHLILHVCEPRSPVFPTLVRTPSLLDLPSFPSLLGECTFIFQGPVEKCRLSLPHPLLKDWLRVSPSRSQRHRDLGTMTWLERVRNTPQRRGGTGPWKVGDGCLVEKVWTDLPGRRHRIWKTCRYRKAWSVLKGGSVLKGWHCG